jgi:hypothetical protein
MQLTFNISAFYCFGSLKKLRANEVLALTITDMVL